MCHLPDHLRPQICDDLMDAVERKDKDASESAFIFNPYAAKRKSDARHEKQETSRWVVGEECSLEVYIANPCSVQLKIERLCLCIEDVSGPPVKSDPISVAVVLPPKTKPTRVSLAVIPHLAGPLRVIGCHVTLYGVTWLQRFVGSLRRVPRLPGTVLVEPEWGREKNMVVNIDVIPSLPLLKWQFLNAESGQAWPATIQEAPRSTGAPHEKEKILHVPVRAGQRLNFRLKITNVSELPVIRAKHTKDGKEKRSTKTDLLHLSLEADEKQLSQKLPILPKEVIELPLRVTVGHKTTASGGSNNKDCPSRVQTPSVCFLTDLVWLQISFLYGGQHTDVTSKSVVFGRELRAPLSFRILPSASIVTVQISHHFVPSHTSHPPHRKSSSRLNNASIHMDSIAHEDLKPESTQRSASARELGRLVDSSSEDVTSSLSRRFSAKERIEETRREASGSSVVRSQHEEIFQFQSECTLRVTIANHDTQVLCVWVGDVMKNTSFEEHQWTPPAAPASHSVVPGQAVQVSCRIPSMPHEEMSLEATNIESMATNWIRSMLCGYWQSVAHQPTFTEEDLSPSHDSGFCLNPSYGSQGTVHLRKEHIARLLDPIHLSTIIHAYITLSVNLSEPFTKGFVNLRETLMADADLTSLMETQLMEHPESDWTEDDPSHQHRSLMHSSSVRSDTPSTPKGPNGEVWGIQTEVGEFLNCEAVISNNTGNDLEDAMITICTDRIDECAESSDVLFRREGSVHDTGILIIGHVSNIPVTVAAASTFKHKYDVWMHERTKCVILDLVYVV